MPKQLWSKERVIAELIEARREGLRNSIRLVEAAMRYFGSLRAALKEAGLHCRKRPPPYNEWSKEFVVKAIRQRKRDGRDLSQTHRDDPSLYAAGKRFFGSWTKARDAAGLPSQKREFYSADEVQLQIIELYEKSMPLRFSSHSDEKLRRSALKHFGGWGRAVESLGLGNELRRSWTDQSIIEAILLRRASNQRIYKTHTEDKALFSAAVKHFGNWPNALQSAGIYCKFRKRWSKAIVVERLQNIASSFPGESIGKNDSNLVYNAARIFGSLGKAREAAGVAPPARCWTDDRVVAAIQSRFAAGEPTNLVGLGDILLTQAAKRRFGSWAEAVKASGLADRIPVREPLRRWTADEVVEAIRDTSNAGRSFNDMCKENNGFGASVRRHYGKWRTALEVASVECERRVWSKGNIIKDIKQRFEANESLSSHDRVNINLVAAAGRYFGSWNNALNAAGVPCKPRKPRQ